MVGRGMKTTGSSRARARRGVRVQTDSRLARPPGHRRGIVMIALAGAQFVLVADFSLATIALPRIGETFDLSRPYLQLVMTAYAIPFGGCMLVGGRVGESCGYKNVFLAGMATFTVAAVAAAAAPSSTVLVFARALQGVGGAAAVPAAFALATSVFSSDGERRRALTANGAAISAGEACGLLLGALLTSALGWRSVFFADAIVGTCVVVTAAKTVPPVPRSSEKGSVSLVAAALITGAGAICVYGTTLLSTARPPAVEIMASAFVAAGLLAAFVLVERQSSSPMTPRHIFSRPGLAHGTAAAAAASGVGTGLTYILSVYFQDGLQYSPLHSAGLLSAFGAAAVMSGTLVGRGRLAAGIGSAATLRRGALLEAAGALTIAVAARFSYVPGIGIGLAALGTGFGVVLVTGMLVVTRETRSLGDGGVVSGLFNSAVELISGLGLALLACVAAVLTSGATSAGFSSDGVAAAACAGAAVMSLAGLWRSRCGPPRVRRPRTGITPRARRHQDARWFQ